MTMRHDARDRLTVVVAAFNEAEALPLLHPRIAAVLDAPGRGVDGRVLYVDDGSRDATWAVLQRIAAARPARRAAAPVAQFRQGSWR